MSACPRGRDKCQPNSFGVVHQRSEERGRGNYGW
eukprot:COSAG03_NODE_21435_length_304_cov_0.756098_1_plen_33_part_10